MDLQQVNLYIADTYIPGEKIPHMVAFTNMFSMIILEKSLSDASSIESYKLF